MPPAHHKDDDTRPYEKKQEAFFTMQMVKVAGFVLALGSPWFVWATVSIFGLTGQVELIKQKQETIQEIKTEIQQMRKDLTDIKIQIAQLTKGNP